MQTCSQLFTTSCHGAIPLVHALPSPPVPSTAASLTHSEAGRRRLRPEHGRRGPQRRRLSAHQLVHRGLRRPGRLVGQRQTVQADVDSLQAGPRRALAERQSAPGRSGRVARSPERVGGNETGARTIAAGGLTAVALSARFCYSCRKSSDNFDTKSTSHSHATFQAIDYQLPLRICSRVHKHMCMLD